MFSTPLLTVASIKLFLADMVELLNSALLAGSTTSKMGLVKAAAAAYFNLSRLALEGSSSIDEDDLISILVALVEALKVLSEKDSAETKELRRLIVVSIGGYIVLSRGSETVKEVLGGIEAVDVIRRSDASESQEVIVLIGT
jgi:PUL domain